MIPVKFIIFKNQPIKSFKCMYVEMPIICTLIYDTHSELDLIEKKKKIQNPNNSIYFNCYWA